MILWYKGKTIYDMTQVPSGEYRVVLNPDLDPADAANNFLVSQTVREAILSGAPWITQP